MGKWALALSLFLMAASPATAGESVRVECLEVKAPTGWSKAEDRFGGVVLSAPKTAQAGGVSFRETISIEAQPAESLDSAGWMKRLSAQYEEQRVRQAKAGSGKAAPKAKVKASRVAGQKGHAWRIDSQTAIEGKPVDWRLISQTVVYKGVFYQVEAQGGRTRSLDSVARKVFRSLRFSKKCSTP